MKNINSVGIFGHYGNQNLGDEAIIEAMISNLRKKKPDIKLSCFSIDPWDSEQRYCVDSFPIRYRADFFEGDIGQNKVSKNVNQENLNTVDVVSNEKNNSPSKSLKTIIKDLPLIGPILKSIVNLPTKASLIRKEIYLLLKAKKKLEVLDLLIICGSNQFLDNFGGPWGFPYTLLKWTLLAKLNHTKVAFVSIGAGPLTHSLSYKMLNIALSKADFLSYRDLGSKQLVESRLKNINGKVYPDIAHSLLYEPIGDSQDLEHKKSLVIGINPMPVYDRRYWFEYDDEKYHAYIINLADICLRVTEKGHDIKLFGSQKSDANVINDILNIYKKGDISISEHCLKKIENIMDSTVSGLMKTIDSCDVVIATRFHATVLPLMLNKPVIGICYYRKASDLLDEVGLGGFHTPIDDFESDKLMQIFDSLIEVKTNLKNSISSSYLQYSKDLDEQYEALLKL